MHGAIDIEVNPSHTVARVDIPLVGKGTDSESKAALNTLRDDDPAGDGRQGRRRDYAVTGADGDVRGLRTRC